MDFGPPAASSVSSHAHHHQSPHHHHHPHHYGSNSSSGSNSHPSNHHAPHAQNGYPTPRQQYSSLPQADSAGAASHAHNVNHNNNHNTHQQSTNSNNSNPMPSPAPSSTTSPQLNTASTYYSGDARSGIPSSASASSPGLTRPHTHTPLSHPAQQSQSHAPHQSPPHTSHQPSDRSLPHRDAGDSPNATDEENDRAFEDAYVQFVMYCNPTFPISGTDTLDLRKNFSSPPKSDGKSFNTRVLYDLLRKLDNKVIKTWTELALELGVQRPAVDQGQSSQKVQQYSVRLKRWLRASHIDAFFDHMMGKVPNYIRDIPPPGADPFPEFRDGVCRDDDLALRALKPEFRPKRGRRRADEVGDDMEPISAIEPKRPHLDTSMVGSASGAFATPQTGYPHSAYPTSQVMHSEEYEGGQKSQWLSTPASTPAPTSTVRTPSGAAASFRFQHHLSANPAETPTTPHPLSAVPMTPTPLSAHPDSAYPHSTVDEVPPSASSAYLTQSQKMRMRRRHGTAVSSAWPGNNTTPNGKLRGRPPSNRTIKDGQFISFPANPAGTSARRDSDIPRATPTSAVASTPQADPGADRTPIQSASTASPNIESPFSMRGGPQIPTPVSASSATGGKPGRMSLSLQVPQHVGNPVHLVTPPTVTINGAPTPSTAGSTVRDAEAKNLGAAMQMSQQHQQQVAGGFLHPSGAPTSAPIQGYGVMGGVISAEALQRALAADLVRASVTGRRKKRMSTGPDAEKGKATKNGKKKAKTGGPPQTTSSLRGTEARDLAGVILRDLRAGYGLPTRGSTPGGSETSPTTMAPYIATPDTAVESSFRSFCAAWLGIPLPNSTTTNRTEKRVIVRKFRVDEDGYESPIGEDEQDEEEEEEEESAGGRSKQLNRKKVKEVFDVEWDLGVGGMTAKVSMKGLVLEGSFDASEAEDATSDAEGDGDTRMEEGDEDEEESWEKKYKKLESALKKRNEELRALKEAVLDVALKT